MFKFLRNLFSGQSQNHPSDTEDSGLLVELFEWVSRVPHMVTCTVLLRSKTAKLSESLIKELNELLSAEGKVDASGEAAWDMSHENCRKKLFTRSHHEPLEENKVLPSASDNFFWPEGPEEIAKHKSRVSIVCAGDDLIDCCITATKAAALIARGTKSIAVQWSDTVTQPVELFVDQGAEIDPEDLPLTLWLKILPFEEEDGSRSVATLGMGLFGEKDIETRGGQCPFYYTMNLVASMASQLIQKTLEFSEGDKFCDETVTVRIAKSNAWSSDEPVYVLEIADSDN